MEEYRYKRIVVGKNDEGKSAVLTTTGTNVQQEPNRFYRATLWSTSEHPVDNSIEGDRAEKGIGRNPPKGGSHVRVLELYPDNPDKEKLLAQVKEAHEKYGQKYKPTDEDLARHPMMHRTDTLDIVFVVRGEVYLITDVDEIRCTPGDCVIVRGTNHAWSVRGTEPCLMMGVMLDAHPLD
ncbi:cupin domain-containing protein [Cupriavidus sp. TMH.W2]|uniref:cupin domain-containing protein n=1 Tax=Cupriavidus sp. TMH.W2 TaxID=3434465 RepID=UPI003D770FE6